MPRLIWRLLLVAAATALAGAVALVDPSPAWACSCAPTSVQQSLDRADAVFTGTVTRSDRNGYGADAQLELRFDVSRVFKGQVYDDQVLFTAPDGGGCGLEAEVGSSWLIFATTVYDGSGDQLVSHLTSDLCSGSLPAPRRFRPCSAAAGTPNQVPPTPSSARCAPTSGSAARSRSPGSARWASC